MVHDHSRLAYSEIPPDEKGPTCAGFITRAAAYFAAQGVSRIERAITDNHFGYRRSTQVAAAIAQLGATHKFIKPHCPWQNGPANRVGLPPGLRLQPRALAPLLSFTTLDDATARWQDDPRSADCARVRSPL
jgi:hypothetical protein